MKNIALISSNYLLKNALFTLLSPWFLVEKFTTIPQNKKFDHVIFDEPTRSEIEAIPHTLGQILCLCKKNISYPPYVRVIHKPFKYNELLENILQENILKFHIKNFVFFPTLRTLQDKNKDPVYLTEKESEILYILCVQTTNISREALLKEIWDYQPDITTHTLETHIYRLRKKLKDDNSSILKTHENGYILIKS